MEQEVHFERYATVSRTCVPVGSRGQYVAIMIEEQGLLFEVDHCTAAGMNGGFFQVPNEDDPDVVACRASNSVPYCPYDLNKRPQRYHCNPWCLLESIWLPGPGLSNCVAGGLGAPLRQGEPFSLYEINDCSPTSPSIAPDTLNARITPFQDAQQLLGLGRLLIRMQIYGDPTCEVSVQQLLLRADDCASNIQRNTFGSCADLGLEYYGSDGYGCHLRNVIEIGSASDFEVCFTLNYRLTTHIYRLSLSTYLTKLPSFRDTGRERI